MSDVSRYLREKGEPARSSLSKCPLCNGDARYAVTDDRLVGTKFAVVCNDCRLRTDWWPRATDAANAWNVRVGGRKLALERREC